MYQPLRIMLTILLGVQIAGANLPVAASGGRPTSQADGSVLAIESTPKLADGLYLVLRSAHERAKLEPLSETETIVSNDFHFLEPAEREPIVYLVLLKKPFVPFILGSAPSEDREEATGKPRLQLQLAEDKKGPLEAFTRAHLGETVAIVIGGDVVTTHKVKSVITGGGLQITRCTKHGCETLYTKLLGSGRN